MATASHEHIPGLPNSLSKTHHHAPISELWGLSLSQQPCKSEAESDYAMEIARDISRGPLMSSASSVPLHENSHDEPSSSVSNATTSNSDITISSNSPSPSTQKVRSSSGIWMPSSAVTANNGNSSRSTSSTHTPQGNQNASLMGLAPSTSPTYRGSHNAVVPLSTGTLSKTVNPASAPPGMAPVVVTGSSSSVPRSSVGSIGQFRSGIWGPRQSFSGAFNASTTFAQPTQSTPAVYGKTPWSMDVGTNAVSKSVAIPVQSAGFYNTIPGSVSGTLPATSLMQKAATPPQSSPSPIDATGIVNGARLYTGPSPQMQQHVGHHMASVPSQTLRSQQQQTQAVHVQPVQVQVIQPVQPHQGHQQQQQQHHHHHDGRPPKKNGRPSTNTELYKTELCASFMSTGGNCPYGEKCQFAHGPQELKSVDRPPKWRSKPCQNWVKTGTCSYNERCCFRHDVPVGHDNP